MELARKHHGHSFRPVTPATVALLAGVAATLGASVPALAQDTDGRATGDPAIEEVVVVGSLIRRREVYEGRAPMHWTLDYRDVIAQGQSFQSIVDDDCRDDGRPDDARIERDSSGQLSVVSTD